MTENISYDEMKLLIDKHIIKKGTYVQLNNVNHIDYKVEDIKCNDDGFLFTVKNMDTSSINVVKQQAVTSIEHMNLKRFVQAYSVDDELNTINIIKRTNVMKNIVNKKEAEINGVKLSDGVKIILHNDKTDRMNNKLLTVKGVGDSIKLVAPRGRPKKNA